MRANQWIRVLVSIIVLLTLALPEPAGVASSYSGFSNVINSRAAAAAASIAPPSMTVVAGSTHTCVLTREGGVVCWGANSNGQLGNGTTAEGVPTPGVVQGMRSGIISLSLDGDSTCALSEMGKVYCWGVIPGDLTGLPIKTPKEMTSLGSQVVQLASTWSSDCALTLTGKVMCWGANDVGQLGDGTTNNSATPVTTIASGAVQISAANYTTCAVMQTGEVQCWGDGGYGNLGNGSAGIGYHSSVPVKVVLQGGAALTGATQVSLGTVFGCALTGAEVKCWGNNRFGQLGNGEILNSVRAYAAPVLNSGGGSALSGVEQISAGEDFLCARLTGGNLKCWGRNENGQLGNNTLTNTGVPVPVLDSAGTAALSGVSQVSAGGFHTCAFTGWENEHPFYCWGHNGMGQGGNGDMMTNTTLTLPTPVLDFSSLPVGGDLVSAQIIAGGAHTCSFTANDGLKCWGSNTDGQLGDGTTTTSDAPVAVAGLSSDVKSVALGQNFTCAILPWGRVKCWGSNAHGQLATGNKTDSALPVAAILPAVTVTQLAAGNEHACALTLTGSVVCWGDNAAGQLGNNTITETLTPVTAIASGAVWVAAGGSTSCAVLGTGEVKCWGQGENGQLGDAGSGAGHYQAQPVAVQVSGGASLASAKQVALGADFGCALLDSGAVDCWGKNDLGQLGRGAASTTPSAYAAAVVTTSGGTPPLDGVRNITAGGAHACARLYTNRLKCWGQDESGQIGDGSSGTGAHTALPHPVLDHYATTPVYLEGVIQVSAGSAHTCAFLNWSDPLPYRCWGSNSSGQLGDGGVAAPTIASASSDGHLTLLSATDRPYPNPVQNLLAFASPPLAKTVSGSISSCAITLAGGVKCWGNNQTSTLGNGSNDSSTTPVNVVGLSSGVVSLSAGQNHVCALTSSGGVKCWGYNTNKQLGIISPDSSNVPVDVPGLTTGIIGLSAGGWHTCALLSTGGVKCWGYNQYGQLGDNTTTTNATPVDVVGLTSGVIGLAAGANHTCALTATGGVKCWGEDNLGQLGDGRSGEGVYSSVPVNANGAGSGIIDLEAGGFSTCSLDSVGAVKCWGQLAQWTDLSSLSSDVSVLSVGWAHACAILVGGGVKCWGNNEYHQIGNGKDEYASTPEDVVGLSAGVISISAGYVHTCAILAGTAPLRCWGENGNGQFGDGTKISSSVPVVSKWLTADGLVEDNKTQVIIPTIPDTVIVIPAQPVEEPVTVTVTEETNPPAPCAGCVTLRDGTIVVVDSDEKGEVHAWFYFNYSDYSSPVSTAALQTQATDFDAQKLNLYQYVDGSWTPMLPCTGCTLDLDRHLLKVALNGDGMYRLMLSPSTTVYLPFVMRQ